MKTVRAIFKRLERWLPFILLAALVAGGYANSLGNEFVSDDIPAIALSPEIGSWSAVFSDLLFPLRPLFYLAVYRAFGPVPAPFRLLNIIFHLGSVFVLYLLVSGMRTRRTGFWAAAVLAVHPLAVEAVGWISGGPYAQSAFFLLLSLLFLDRSARNGRCYFFSLAAFVAGLMSSDKAVFFPLAAALFVIYFQDIRKRWRALVPYFFLAGIWAVFLLARIEGRRGDLRIEHYQSEAFYNPLVQLPVAITSYLELGLWPLRLTLYHSEMTFTFSGIVFRWLILASLGVLVCASFRRRRPEAFWMLFFLFSLAPTLTPLAVAWVVAERYVYAGLAGLAAAGTGAILNLLSFRPKTAGGILTAVVLLLLARTARRNLDWKSEDTLWPSAARFSPSSPANHNNLGDLYSRRGQWEKAEASFRRAIELKPGYADAYHNLAGVYLRVGRIDLAEMKYRRAIHYNPRLWQSRLQLGAILFNRGDRLPALEQLEAAADVNPSAAEIRFNLGVVYRALGREGEAARQFRIASELDPDLAPPPR